MSALDRLACSAAVQPVQPELVPAVLAILPERISKIELATDATDPVLTVLSRFKRLCTLNISGNGAFLDWQARGAAAVVPKLKMLRLDCRDLEQLYKYADGLQSPKEHIIPDSDNPPCRLDSIIPNALAAATALSSLELVLDWTEDVAALCRGLPALRNLRWVVHSNGGWAGFWAVPPVAANQWAEGGGSSGPSTSRCTESASPPLACAAWRSPEYGRATWRRLSACCRCWFVFEAAAATFAKGRFCLSQLQRQLALQPPEPLPFACWCRH